MSSESSSSKAWIWAVAAGAAVIGASVVYYLASRQEDSGSDLFEEIDGLGTP